ncbi:MAG TPA: hypothetical protein PKU67_02605 [Candidatus Hydrothermia bacterium]|nr:hypothetical protein [Candidatus Hydrothermia bacterium]HOL23614.1 hypothetical protein [Candidatus Hydrothermia bacterium]HPO78620.1 hypothetical protein [Candidatus Hydrothermia bacterium]
MKKLLFIILTLFVACAPKEPKIEILDFSIPDSIGIHDPDGDPTNSWHGGPDSVITNDSIQIDLNVKYEGATVGYLTEILWVLKSLEGANIKTFSAIIYPPIPMEDGQQRRLSFYIYFDNYSAYVIDSIYDDTLNYYGIGKVDLYITGTTYEQFMESGKISFNLRFVP